MGGVVDMWPFKDKEAQNSVQFTLALNALSKTRAALYLIYEDALEQEQERQKLIFPFSFRNKKIKRSQK